MPRPHQYRLYRCPRCPCRPLELLERVYHQHGHERIPQVLRTQLAEKSMEIVQSVKDNLSKATYQVHSTQNTSPCKRRKTRGVFTSSYPLHASRFAPVRPSPPNFSLALGPVFAEETFGRGDGLPGRRERVVDQLAGQGRL